MQHARTIFDKIWDSHVVTEREDGECLLYIDRLLLQENSFHAFDKIRRENRKVRNPGQAFAFADHYVPTLNRSRGLDAIADPEIRNMVELIEADTRAYDITLFDLGDIRQGIRHIVQFFKRLSPFAVHHGRFVRHLVGTSLQHLSR